MKRVYHSNLSFLDLLFNTLLGFVALFSLAYLQMKIENKKDNLEAKAEFMIIVTWDKESKDDVDSYVEDPFGHLVCFQRREDGLMHLDRDDLGRRNDIMETPYGVVEFDENREIVNIRGIVPGEYVVNAHMYRKIGTAATKVTIRLDKINPFSTVTVKEIELTKNGDEKTAFRFSVDKEGNVTAVNDIQKELATPRLSNRYEDGEMDEGMGP